VFQGKQLNTDRAVFTAQDLDCMRGLLPKDLDQQHFDFVVKTCENAIIKKNSELMLNTNTSACLNDDCLILVKCALVEAKYDPRHIDSLVDFLRRFLLRISGHFKVALNSYFTYLKLNNVDDCSNDVSLSVNPNIVLATLRIIKMLVKYSHELKAELDDGLDKTVTASWCGIIPQLFCRLNHTNLYVRDFISGLLCRIARNYSHLIIYPTIVGSIDGPTKIATMTGGSKPDKSEIAEKNLKRSEKSGSVDDGRTFGDLIIIDETDVTADDNDDQLDENNDAVVVGDEDNDNDDDDDDDDNDNEDEKQTELKNSYKGILNTLNETNSKMIAEVKLFIVEMRRITLLREELWLGRSPSKIHRFRTVQKLGFRVYLCL
jgi:hypothetical protein